METTLHQKTEEEGVMEVKQIVKEERKVLIDKPQEVREEVRLNIPQNVQAGQ